MKQKSKKDEFRSVAIVLIVSVLVFGVGGYCAYTAYNAFFADSAVENKFGDQHLKTAVALIELHKVRYGAYPSHISDIKFTGGWDTIHLESVKYSANENRTRYYVDVSRGWVGKPTIVYPPEFWQGTGFDPGLRPQD